LGFNYSRVERDRGKKESQEKPEKAMTPLEEQIRDGDIQALLEAGVSMMKLEDLYGAKTVHRVAEAYIISHQTTTMEDDIPATTSSKKHEDRRSRLATLLFLRAPSSSLQSIMKSNDVVDAVFEALVADPDDPMLMDPLLHTLLHDPVLLNSGIIVDRSTAMDPVTGGLRLTKCPFRRIPLHLPVYPVLALQDKLRAWEYDRLERCVSVAQTMMIQQQQTQQQQQHGQYDRVEKVLRIAHGFLQEHQQRLEIINKNDGTVLHDNNNNNISSNKSREILLLALQLAQLEREIPGVTDDIPRTVEIHHRLMTVAKACSSDKADLETLVMNCLEDCWKRCSMLLAFAGKNATRKALVIRQEFSPLIKYTTLHQLNLLPELQKLCHLDLTLAKHVEDEPSIWNCRRVLLKLLSEASQRTEFLQSEGITGNEDDLYYHLPYDHACLWPYNKFTDPAIGLVHFGDNNYNNNRSSSNITVPGHEDPVPTETAGLVCKVNLNPLPKGDHWIEVAFMPDTIQSPGHLNSILSQHGEGGGWEIRCAVRPRPSLPFGHVFMIHNFTNPDRKGPLVGDDAAGGIHVEAVWTTTAATGRGGATLQYNEFTNPKVALEIGTWYHVILAYCHERNTVSLYVNGQVVRRQVTGDFCPAQQGGVVPRMGQNMQWLERKFQGWVAFAGGGYELPVSGMDTDALDEHVRKLCKARLSKLPKQPAMHRPKVLEDDEEDSNSGVEGDSSSCLESMSSASALDDGGIESEQENEHEHEHENEHEHEDGARDHDNEAVVVG
jgi:U-box domain